MIFTRERRLGAGLLLAAALCVFAPQEIRASVAEQQMEGVMGQSIREEMSSEMQGETDLDGAILNAAGRSLLGGSAYADDFLSKSFTTVSDYTGITYYHNIAYQDRQLIQGIDVSYWQSKGKDNDETRKVSALDWSKIHDAGIDFAFVRVAGRYLSSSGGLYIDDCADSHIRGAMANDINVGVYIFSQAITVKEAEEEADYVLDILEANPDWDITMPVVFDAETTAGGRLAKAKLSKSKMTQIAQAFCEKIADAGYTPMIYGGITMFGSGMDAQTLAQNYKLWFSRYNFTTTSGSTEKLQEKNNCTAYSDVSYGYEFWQYSSTAKISGYSGNLDVSFWYKNTKVKTTGVAASSTASSVTLSWNQAGDADGYRVYRYDAAQDKYVYVGATTKRSYTDTGLDAGTTYRYKVRCYWKIGGTKYYGTYSSALSTSTLPAEVGNVTVDDTTTTGMTLHWDHVENVTGYEIYQYDAGVGSYAKIGDVAADQNSYALNGLTAATEYRFQVRAYVITDGTTSYGAFSKACLVATLPETVKNFLASTGSSTGITLSWDKVERATGYQIYRMNADGEYEKVATVKGASKVTYTNSGLQSGEEYTYKVRAYKTCDGAYYYGSFSEVDTATTKPAKVSGLKLTTKSKTVTLSWNAVSGATGYQIYRLNTKTGKYERIASVKGTTTYKNTKLKKGTSYKYKVRAYKSYENTNYFGSFSTAAKITAK